MIKSKKQSLNEFNQNFKISLPKNLKIETNQKLNNDGFIIGAKHTNGMGKIGVRDGNKRARAIGTSKSLYYEVK